MRGVLFAASAEDTQADHGEGKAEVVQLQSPGSLLLLASAAASLYGTPYVT